MAIDQLRSDAVNVGKESAAGRTRHIAFHEVPRPGVTTVAKGGRSSLLKKPVAASGNNDAITAALQYVLAERDALNAKFQTLQAQAAELELVRQRLSAIEASTSWRITSPLRRLVDATCYIRTATTELVKLAGHIGTGRTGTHLPDAGGTRPKAHATSNGASSGSGPVGSRVILGQEGTGLAQQRRRTSLSLQAISNGHYGGANLEVAALAKADPDARLDRANLTNLDSAPVDGSPESDDLKPHMADDELACLERLLRRSKKVLEYGCGGSTVFAASLEHCHILGVESDLAWLRKVEAQPVVRDGITAGRIVLKHANIGPTAEWGVPSDGTSRYLWSRYGELPWTQRSDYDLIFVDGRFRVACILHSVLRAPSDALIAVHDFWVRPEYHVVLPFLEWKETTKTLGVFRKRSKIDRALVRGLIDEYQYICD
jgi:hypothetical protein